MTQLYWRIIPHTLKSKPEDIVSGLFDAQLRVGDAFSFGASYIETQATRHKSTPDPPR